MSKVVIALGANLGDRANTIHAALEAISSLPSTAVLLTSTLVESAAVKPEGIDESAPEYLNAVAIIETQLNPEQLLTELNVIEQSFGRTRVERWGDRTLDLDIVDFEGITQHTEELTLPHPRAHERSFVLIPWLEIDAEATLPGYGHIAELVPKLAHEVKPHTPESSVVR